ncbi:DUF3320 domain-containing protein [Meridianimarinicoccus roseus]|nr:DUF3320 domain-containing protein [Meridianimarinicoccus roseus]
MSRSKTRKQLKAEHAKRSKASEDRKRADGLAKVTIWVPTEHADRMKAEARKLCELHQANRVLEKHGRDAVPLLPPIREPRANKSETSEASEAKRKFFKDSYQPALREMVLGLVDSQGPILKSHLTLRLARDHGFDATGARIRKTLEPHFADLVAKPHGKDTLFWPTHQEPVDRLEFRGMTVAGVERSWVQVPDEEKLHLIAEILGREPDDPIRELCRRIERTKVTEKLEAEFHRLRNVIEARHEDTAPDIAAE